MSLETKAHSLARPVSRGVTRDHDEGEVRHRVGVDLRDRQPALLGVLFDTTADVPAPADRRGAALYVALVDSGHVSDVKAGENKGVRLTHDHVVRAVTGTTASGTDGRARVTGTLPWPKDAGRAPTLVAVMQNPATGDVLQALALPLDACR